MGHRSNSSHNRHGEDEKQAETQRPAAHTLSDLDSLMRAQTDRGIGEISRTIKGAATKIVSETIVAENQADEQTEKAREGEGITY